MPRINTPLKALGDLFTYQNHNAIQIAINELWDMVFGPDAPIEPITDDLNNTYGWTDVLGLDYTSAEVSVDSGTSYVPANGNPHTGVGGNYPIGTVLVRYAAIPGVRIASQPLANTVAFTGGADVTPPTVVSATVINPTTIRYVFSETVTLTNLGFDFKKNGTTHSPTAVTGSGTTWDFTVGTILNTDIILRSYDQTSGDAVDLNNNALVSFTDVAVTNSLPITGYYIVKSDATVPTESEILAGTPFTIASHNADFSINFPNTVPQFWHVFYPSGEVTKTFNQTTFGPDFFGPGGTFGTVITVGAFKGHISNFDTYNTTTAINFNS